MTRANYLINSLTKSCDNIVTGCDAEECVSWDQSSVYNNNVKVRIRPGHYRLNIDIIQAGLGVIILPLECANIGAWWPGSDRPVVTSGQSSPVIGQPAPAPAPAHPITAPQPVIIWADESLCFRITLVSGAPPWPWWQRCVTRPRPCLRLRWQTRPWVKDSIPGKTKVVLKRPEAGAGHSIRHLERPLHPLQQRARATPHLHTGRPRRVQDTVRRGDDGE